VGGDGVTVDVNVDTMVSVLMMVVVVVEKEVSETLGPVSTAVEDSTSMVVVGVDTVAT
jgi:hypothetical protein